MIGNLRKPKTLLMYKFYTIKPNSPWCYSKCCNGFRNSRIKPLLQASLRQYELFKAVSACFLFWNSFSKDEKK